MRIYRQVASKRHGLLRYRDTGARLGSALLVRHADISGRTHAGRPRAFSQPDTGNDPTWTADKCYGYRCTQRALDFLEKHKDEDFLLVISYDEPHGPALCPIEYSRMYEDFTFPTNVNVNDALTDKPEEQRVWAVAAA